MIFETVKLWRPACCECVFFPNQAALEGFLQSGLRNRIGWLGGTGSPSTARWFPACVWGFPNEDVALLSLYCRFDAALMSL